MTNQLQKVIRRIISEVLRDYPILVWYDEGGTLLDIMLEAVPPKVNFVQYSGSYLAIRAEVETKDPEFKEKWLIYVPEEALDPSWIRDYELFGKRIDMNLEKVLVKHFKLESDQELKNLLAGERGRILAAEWGEVMKNITLPLRKEHIINGLLSIAFNLGASFSLGRAILEYVTSPKKYNRELSKLNLHGVFANLINSELGLKVEPKPEVLPEKLASALLFSELVFYSNGLGKQKFEELLPKQNKLETWARLARDWLEYRSLKGSFIRWSERLAKKYDLKSELQGIDRLLNVMSFSIVDEILLEELKTRILSEPDGYVKNLNLIRRVAEAREQSPWDIRKVWSVISLASELYLQCKKAIAFLEGNTIQDMRVLVEKYVGEKGWWMIDSIYRRVATKSTNIDEEIYEIFLKPSYSIYARWLRLITQRFSQAVDKIKKWEVKGLLKQSEFWEKIVEREEKPIVIFFIDALRYELGEELKRYLIERGYEVDIIPMLSSLPSITEIGMASLMPHKGKPLFAEVEKGELRIKIEGNIPITRRRERINFIKDILGDRALFLELDDVLKSSPASLKNRVNGHEYIIVMDREIDVAGTYLLEVSLDLFRKLVQRISKAVSRFHKSGLSKIIITTDHGFLLIPKGCEVTTIEGVKAERDVDKKRRYAIGKLPKIASLIDFSMEQLGLIGDGIASFPRGLSCLSMAGPIPMFLHGGISPQENCIPILISRAKIEIEKVGIKAEIPDEITTAVFLVNLIPLVTPTAKGSRAVRIEVYSDKEKIAESDVIELQKGAKKARLVLKKIKPQVEVRVIDVDTLEILRSKKVKICLVGYFDEI